tara:strand:+ start:115 stop:339 length:225 start_codon:yes stop_codon:yes gene_type:complete
MKLLISFITLASILLFFGTSAYAYIGPGMGLGAIVTILGIVGAVLLSIAAIIYYPIKRLIIKIQNKKKNQKKVE